MKAIILARVSTEEQMNEGQSIPAQLARAREYAKRKGLKVYKEFQFDESSTKDQRKKFEQVIEEIKKSKEKVALIVECVDRLQRSFKESVLLDDFRKQDKVEIHFIRENLVVHRDSNSSEIQRWDLGVFIAKSYVLQISDNVKRTLELKLRNGEWIGKAPIGYLNIKDENDNKDIILDRGRAPLIKKAFELYASGQYSLLTLYKFLKKEGLRNNTTQRGEVSKGQLHQILQNPFYYGEMLIKGKLYPHKYKPLITKQLFDKVQEVRISWGKKPFKHVSLPFVFRGLIRCGQCGCAITPERKKEKYVYYHCTGYRGNCKKVWIKEEELINQIADVFKNMQIPDDVLTWLTEELRKSHAQKTEYHRQILSNLQKEYDRLQKRIERMYEDKLDGGITTDLYDRKLKEYKQKQEDIALQIEEHTKADKNYYLTSSMVLELASRAYEIFKSSKVEEKRQLLNFLLQNCLLEGKKLKFELKKPFDVILHCANRQLWLRRPDSNRQPTA